MPPRKPFGGVPYLGQPSVQRGIFGCAEQIAVQADGFQKPFKMRLVDGISIGDVQACPIEQYTADFVAGGGIQRIEIPLADDQQAARILKTPPAFLHRTAAGVGLPFGKQVLHWLVVGGNVLFAVFFEAFALHVVERQADIGAGELPRRQRAGALDEI